jgi:hypothetical protein
VTAFKHKGKWRLQNRELLEKIKRAWPHGYVDIRACVDGRIEGRGVMGYVMKYQTKSVDKHMSPKQLKIAELTHAWNKVFGTRDVIGRQFLERLNLHAVEPEASPSGWELKDIEIRPSIGRLIGHEVQRSYPAPTGAG